MIPGWRAEPRGFRFTSPTTRRMVLRWLVVTGRRLLTGVFVGSAVSTVPVYRWLFKLTSSQAATAGADPPASPPDDKRLIFERRAVNPYRLPLHVVPSRYDLRLEPDLHRFTFTGSVTIAVMVGEQTSELLLNAVELEIGSAEVANDAGAVLRGTVQLEEQTERCRISFPRPLTAGAWRFQLRFSGILNDKLRGFYRSSYKNQRGQSRTLAATQFEATDARRAFPCWDEPSFKAIFSSTLVIDPALTAVSNTGIATERLEGEKKVIQFHDTIRMSTYLVAFIVGELDATEPVSIGGTPLRVWSVPGKRHLTRFGQEIGAFSLKFFQDYYGLPYPGDKLDLVAIPDFASGAMENLGAITFRETALLIDPAIATHAELERVADVVAHENAHMWFGDLVTMSWWNGLWLNEAFATFMEMLAVDVWKPQWRRWSTFGVSRAAALAVDGLHSTRPIEYPVEAPSDADAMFDVLTYEKGASVLRMIEQFLGPQVFRDGVRDYLKTHAYGNADTGDLWAALGRAAKAAVPEVMHAWIFTPGYPMIAASLDRGALVIRQRRFTYLPASLADDSGQAPATPEPRWQVPVGIRITVEGQSRAQRVLLKDAETRVELPERFDSVVVNESGHGFYRVRYSTELLDHVLRHLPDKLAPVERFNLLNDAWAAAVAGLMPMADYLDLTARFKADRDHNVWTIQIASWHGLNRIIEPSDRSGLERLVRDRVRPLAMELGWNPPKGEDELTRQLRGDLLHVLGTLGNDPAVQKRAVELFEQAEGDQRQHEHIDPNVLPALIAILAYTGDEARYNDFFKRFRSAATPQEERRYLYALAGFRRRQLVDQTLAKTINGEIRTQDAPFLIRSLLMSVHGREQAWAFVKANWDVMDRLFPKNGLRRMCEGITGLATRELEGDVRRFFSERRIDLGGKTLAQYLEQLRIAVVLRERESESLRQYLLKAER
jgi:puromycin-sensitive aminopeptidase